MFIIKLVQTKINRSTLNVSILLYYTNCTVSLHDSMNFIFIFIKRTGNHIFVKILNVILITAMIGLEEALSNYIYQGAGHQITVCGRILSVSYEICFWNYYFSLKNYTDFNSFHFIFDFSIWYFIFLFEHEGRYTTFLWPSKTSWIP